MKTLTITEERILEAVKKCSQAKEILKALFPEVFKQEINLSQLERSNDQYKLFTPYSIYGKIGASCLIEIRNSGPLKHKAFWLSQEFDWKIQDDNTGSLCLIPTLKQVDS